MIKALLDIIDRLMQLKNIRDKKRRNLLVQVLDPLFNDLMIVHKDYVSMFEDVLHRLPTYGSVYPKDMRNESKARVKEAFEYLRQKRIEFEPVRTKIRATSNELGSMHFDPYIDDLVKWILLYLPEGTLVDDFNSASQELLKKLQYWKDSPNIDDADFDGVPFRIDVYNFVKHTVDDNRIIWSRVCEAMARLKIDVAKKN
ncbi:MAG: hypothetical protein ACOZF2_11935 [Thermodesulfobacteriota bacterium]